MYWCNLLSKLLWRFTFPYKLSPVYIELLLTFLFAIGLYFSLVYLLFKIFLPCIFCPPVPHLWLIAPCFHSTAFQVPPFHSSIFHPPPPFHSFAFQDSPPFHSFAFQVPPPFHFSPFQHPHSCVLVFSCPLFPIFSLLVVPSFLYSPFNLSPIPVFSLSIVPHSCNLPCRFPLF